MDIYNRWGVKLFETETVEPGWNGNIQNDGSPAPEGTYYYLVDYCRFNGTTCKLKGYLTLIRN
jgi:gliding motility-associated-like protein